MKKSIIVVLLTACLFLSGCSGVSQEDYNSLLEENDRLQEEYSSLQSQYEKLNIDYNATYDLLKSYGEEIYDLKLQLEAQAQSESSNDSTSSTTPEETKVYEDDFIKINYVGFGKGAKYPFQDRDCLILSIENKTDTTFEFLPNSLALDGNDEGSLACYEKISPKSKGKIYFLKMSDTDQYFKNRTPSKISCELSVKDYSNIGVFGENNWWHKISFVDIDIKDETSPINDTSDTETIPSSTFLPSIETDEATNNTNELPLNEWLSYENTLNEMQDEYILGENPGDKWYYRGSGLFVTYIDDESYNNRADEDLITGAYTQMSLNVIAHPDNIVPLYIFEWVKKNGEIVANGFVTVDENENILHTLEWNGEYSYLNSHPKQLELFYTNS